jgi:hypothetical protein
LALSVSEEIVKKIIKHSILTGFGVAILFEIIWRLSGGLNAPSYILEAGPIVGKMGYPLFYYLDIFTDNYRCPIGICALSSLLKSICVGISLSFNIGILLVIFTKVRQHFGQSKT